MTRDEALEELLNYENEYWFNPSGQRVEDKINWAIKFLKEYGYEITKV